MSQTSLPLEPPAPVVTQRLPGLDGLRALSVLGVLAAHVVHAAGFPALPWLRDVAALGAIGVDVFFGISGFLITWLLLMERGRTGRVSLGGFYRRRAFRILPAAVAFLVVIGVLGPTLGFPVTPGELVASLLFVRNLSDGTPVTGHYWTLSVEEQFYLVWPVVLLLCPRKALLPLLVAACAASPLWRHAAGWLAGGAQHVNWWRADLRADSLLLGALGAVVLQDARIGAGMARLARSGWMGPAGAVLFLAALVPWADRPGWVALLTPSISGAAVLAVVVGVTHAPGAWMTRALEAAPLVWLGRLSYSLYLWQQPFCFREGAGGVQGFPLNIAVALGCAWLSYRFIESPFLALRARHPQAVAAPPPPATA